MHIFSVAFLLDYQLCKIMRYLVQFAFMLQNSLFIFFSSITLFIQSFPFKFLNWIIYVIINRLSLIFPSQYFSFHCYYNHTMKQSTARSGPYFIISLLTYLAQPTCLYFCLKINFLHITHVCLVPLSQLALSLSFAMLFNICTINNGRHAWMALLLLLKNILEVKKTL